jgi:hypothetical protein
LDFVAEVMLSLVRATDQDKALRTLKRKKPMALKEGR